MKPRRNGSERGAECELDQPDAAGLAELEAKGAATRAERLARGANLGPIHEGFTVIAGYGWSPHPGTRATVAVGSHALVVAPVAFGQVPQPISYSDLLSFHFDGGARTTGGGFIGGGFGLKGAAGGMVAASVLNALTTKTAVNSFVRISGREGETVLHIPDVTPAVLRNWFAPAVNAVNSLRLTVSQQPRSPSLVDDLNRLVELREQGHLTDEEFATAKAALLGNPAPPSS